MNFYTLRERRAMKKLLFHLPVILSLALLWISLPACKQKQDLSGHESPGPKTSPVQNALQSTPIPIQPLTSTPAMPHSAPVPVPLNTPAETGTAATPSPIPMPETTPSEPPESSGKGTPLPSVTGS